jgi:hypothetical protein
MNALLAILTSLCCEFVTPACNSISLGQHVPFPLPLPQPLAAPLFSSCISSKILNSTCKSDQIFLRTMVEILKLCIKILCIHVQRAIETILRDYFKNVEKGNKEE